MRISMTTRVLALIAVVVGAGCATGSSVAITCQDLQPGAPRYEASMDELARLAKLPGGTWDRYDAAAVSNLCSGQAQEIDSLTADGLLDIAAAQRLAAVLNKPYTPRPRSAADVTFGNVRERLVRLGACNACADNIARYVVEQPKSTCAGLARRALAGEADAVKDLVADPPYCTWKY
jgi:hypothetical protein